VQAKIENIPLELRASSRWVSWRPNGEKGKMILDSKTGKGAVEWPRNPAVWSTFPQALRRMNLTPNRGIGLVIETPFVGLDFDHCIENGKLNYKTAAIVEKLPNTYWEMSPSGTGLHAWYRCSEHAKLPGQTTGLFEVYARSRFLTVTGNKVENSLVSITELPLTAALDIFRLADPSVLDIREFYRDPDDEGYWTTEALAECLDAWKRHARGFDFAPMANKIAVPCPGNDAGWPGGERHSFTDPKLSRQSMAWLANGWPVFACFHAHCQGKTWKDFAGFYDPDKIIFDFDEWQDEQLKNLKEDE
jgi:hypothetical protein